MIGIATVVLALAIAQELAAIAGRVVDDRGQPVAGATVYLLRGPFPGARPAITTDEGRVRWDGVVPAMLIAAAKAGY